MRDKWIDDAFQQAFKDADEIAPIAKVIGESLDENTMTILDRWAAIVGSEKALKIATIVNMNDLDEEMDRLGECYFVAGFLLGKQMYEKDK